MEFLINENQLKILIENNKIKDFSKDLSKLFEFTKDVVNSTSSVFNFNIKMFLTWGASIGGLMMPLDNFVKTNYLDISEENRYLILVGLVMSIFFNTKNNVKEIKDKIKELNLETEFYEILNKAEELLDSFKSFLRSIRITLDQTIELLSYCFLIPIITDIFEILSGEGDNMTNINLIVKRLFLSGFVVLSYTFVKKIIHRLSKLFT